MLRRFRCNYRGCLIVFNVLKAAWLRHFPCCAYIDGAIATVAATINAGGLGAVLFSGLRTMNIDKILGGTICCAALALAFDAGLSAAARACEKRLHIEG